MSLGLIAQKGEKQGPYFQTHLGPYDDWAIEYAYKPINAPSPEKEKPELDKIASRVAEPDLQYGTDEDTLDDARNIDPLCDRYDLTNDPIQYYQKRIALTSELWNFMESYFDKRGTRYQKLRNVFDRGLNQYRISVINVPKYISKFNSLIDLFEAHKYTYSTISRFISHVEVLVHCRPDSNSFSSNSLLI